jgi:hypothetical protein
VPLHMRKLAVVLFLVFRSSGQDCEAERSNQNNSEFCVTRAA